MNRLPNNLPDLLRVAGVPVVEELGWKERGNNFTELVGCMQHHWGSEAAATGAVQAGHCYPKYKSKDPAGVGGGLRTDGRVNCNVFSDRDGAIHLIAAGASNYASCYGSSTVLNELRSDTWPGGTARSRGLLLNSICGNRYFVNMEAEHPGDGSPMSAFQEQNIVKFWSVTLKVLGKSLGQYIGHNEWTARKIDPRWSGPGNRMPVLRDLVLKYRDVGDLPVPPPTEGDTIVTQLPNLKKDDGYDHPRLGGNKDNNIHVQKMQALMAIAGFIAANTFNQYHQPDGKFGPGTEVAVKDFQISASLDGDGVCGELTWNALILYE